MDSAVIIATIASIIKTAVDVGPVVIKGIEDAKPFAEALYNTLFKGHKITEEELAQLEARIKDLSAQLQLPLPPEEEG